MKKSVVVKCPFSTDENFRESARDDLLNNNNQKKSTEQSHFDHGTAQKLQNSCKVEELQESLHETIHQTKSLAKRLEHLEEVVETMQRSYDKRINRLENYFTATDEEFDCNLPRVALEEDDCDSSEDLKEFLLNLDVLFLSLDNSLETKFRHCEIETMTLDEFLGKSLNISDLTTKQPTLQTSLVRNCSDSLQKNTNSSGARPSSYCIDQKRISSKVLDEDRLADKEALRDIFSGNSLPNIRDSFDESSSQLDKKAAMRSAMKKQSLRGEYQADILKGRRVEDDFNYSDNNSSIEMMDKDRLEARALRGNELLSKKNGQLLIKLRRKWKSKNESNSSSKLKPHANGTFSTGNIKVSNKHRNQDNKDRGLYAKQQIVNVRPLTKTHDRLDSTGETDSRRSTDASDISPVSIRSSRTSGGFSFCEETNCNDELRPNRGGNDFAQLNFRESIYQHALASVNELSTPNEQIASFCDTPACSTRRTKFWDEESTPSLSSVPENWQFDADNSVMIENDAYELFKPLPVANSKNACCADERITNDNDRDVTFNNDFSYILQDVAKQQAEIEVLEERLMNGKVPYPKTSRPGVHNAGEFTSNDACVDSTSPNRAMYPIPDNRSAAKNPYKIMTPKEVAEHEAEKKLHQQVRNEARLQEELAQQEEQSREDNLWLRERSITVPGFMEASDSSSLYHTSEDVRRFRDSQKSSAQPPTVPSTNNNVIVPPPPILKCEVVRPAPTMKLDRDNDQVYQQTMNVVRAVHHSNQAIMAAKADEILILVKNIGIALKNLCASLEEELSSIHMQFYREIEMAQKTTNKDLSQIINQAKLVKKFYVTSQVNEYKKNLMAANQVLAMDAKNLLDVIDKARTSPQDQSTPNESNFSTTDERSRGASCSSSIGTDEC